jgi:hypothetical protein
LLIKYEDWEPKAASLAVVSAASDIIEEFQSDGYILTLRQLYYQFVGRGLIENTEKSYKRLGTLMTKARYAGMISWEAIEDRNRECIDYWTREDDQSLIDILPNNIRFDRWARQETYVEVWVEKEALGNVVERACDPLFVPHLSCKGYLSASEAWRAGQRLGEKLAEGKDCTIIHLGDHDPSGLDMTRDNQDRIDVFTRNLGVNVSRIALNMDQVEEYAPPPNPAKQDDSRYKGYKDLYGEQSWELDALQPSVIVDLITEAVEPLIDRDAWHSVDTEERVLKHCLTQLGDRWPELRKEIAGEL